MSEEEEGEQRERSGNGNRESGSTQEAQKMREAESELRSSLRVALDGSAYDRMMNVSHSNKRLFLMSARQILMLFGRVNRKLTDDETLMVLSELKKQTEKKTSITFHSK